MLRTFCTRSRSLTPFCRRYIFGPPAPWPMSSAMRSVARQMEEMEKEMGQWWNKNRFSNEWPMTSWSSFFRPWHAEDATEMEMFRMRNPIVEVNGEKKFKLEFDVRRFKPEEVNVTTSSKDRMLTIEAKHEDENNKFSFSRKMSIPEGVQIENMTCRITEEGVLDVSAPYTPPKITSEAPEGRKEVPIQIKREEEKKIEK